MSDPRPSPQIGAVGAPDESLLERLRRAGLSRYESLVYLGLVQDRNARVVEIARRTGVPQPKVYQALDSLVEKGFCAVGADAVNRYRPIEPGLALEAQVMRLDEQRAEVVALTKELTAQYRAGAEEQRWAPPVEIVKGLPQIRTLLAKQVRQARTELLYFGQSPQVPGLEVAQALWERAEAGLSLRMVFDETYFEDGERRGEEDDLLRRMKGEKRRIAALPSKLIVVDRASAMLSVTRSGSDGLLLLVLRQDGLVAHCRASFEHAWARSSPL